MAAKVFEVNDVLPATTQLRISWDAYLYYPMSIKTDSDNFELVKEVNHVYGDDLYINDIQIYEEDSGIITFNSPYTNWKGNHPYIDIDTSTWSLAKRTVSTAIFGNNDYADFYWEDLNAPSGYTISFNSNGGTTFSDIEEATELPTLPTPTRSGYTFVAWYYESNFQTRATAGDTIESNVTLYAKWHNLGSLFTEIADAIRSKDGTSENIRDVDFGERIKQIQGAKEEETKTVTPNFSSGNEVVTPTSGKVLSQVTINKDSNLIADNIKSGVTIFGITGTYEGEVGYTVTLSARFLGWDPSEDTYIYVKVGEAPTSVSDYNAMTWGGSTTITYKSGSSASTFEGIKKVYIWGTQHCSYKIDGGDMIHPSYDWTVPTEIILSNNIALLLFTMQLD